MKQIRSRCRRTPREFRRMRIVARGARDARVPARLEIPVTARPPVHTGFPIAIRRAVTTAAQLRTVGEFQLTAVAGLQVLEIGFVVAIETIVVSVMTAV